MTSMRGMSSEREFLISSLRMRGAHIPGDKVIALVPPEQRGIVPEGFTHSVYQLLEHMRFCVRDILDYCRNPNYKAHAWPADYWTSVAAPSEEQWKETADGFARVMDEMEELAADPDLDLNAVIPHGARGHTYLRELLIVIDHNAYHLGQVVALLKTLNGGALPGYNGA